MSSKRRGTILDIPEDERPETTAGYKVAEKVSATELLAKDQDDEALNKYKQSLIGDANAAPFPDDERHFIVEEMALVVEGRDPIHFDPNAPSEEPYVLQEGAEYRIRLKFYVQHDIVAGIKFHNVVKRAVFSHKESHMLGSYAPRREVYEWASAVEVAPSGMTGRGKYNCTGRIIDDDGMVHLEFSYGLKIQKQWED